MASALGTRTVTPSVMGSTATGTSIFTVSSRPDLSMMGTFKSPLKKHDEDDNEETKLDPTKPNDHPILKLSSLTDSLRTIERAVTLNVYQNKQATYRGLPVLPGMQADSITSTHHLILSQILTKLPQPVTSYHLVCLTSRSCGPSPVPSRRGTQSPAWLGTQLTWCG